MAYYTHLRALQPVGIQPASVVTTVQLLDRRIPAGNGERDARSGGSASCAPDYTNLHGV